MLQRWWGGSGTRGVRGKGKITVHSVLERGVMMVVSCQGLVKHGVQVP